MTPRQQIAAIDREIDEIHAEACRRTPGLAWGEHKGEDLSDPAVSLAACARWQAAWDANPDLRRRESALYRRRYDAQHARDQEAAGLRRKLERADFKARDIDRAIQDRVTERLLCARRWPSIGERNIAHGQMMCRAQLDANL